MRQRHIGHIGLTNNEISAILDPINMVKSCPDVKATILVFQNKEAAAILNNIIMVK